MGYRLQIAKDKAGTLTAEFPRAVDAGTALVTIKRSGGTDLVGAAVEGAAATVDPVQGTVQAGGTGSRAGLSITNVAFTTVPDTHKPVTVINTDTAQYQLNRVRNLVRTSSDPDLWTVELQYPLAFDMNVGGLIRGNNVTYSVAAANSPEVEEDFRAVFTADIDGIEHTVEVIYDVGLLASAVPIVVTDLDDYWPDRYLNEPIEWEALGAYPAMVQAWEGVALELEAQEINPNRVRSTKPLVPAVVNRTFRALALFGHVPHAWVDNLEGWIERLDTDYARLIGTAVSVLWVDTDDSGTANDPKPVQRVVRLMR